MPNAELAAVIKRDPLQVEADVQRRLVARQGLKKFIKVAWPQIEPAEFIDNWHIDEISAHLEAVTNGDITRLIINVPPGLSKSLIVSVLWPAWEWTLNPAKKTIFASFDMGLSWGHARKMRNLIISDWWRRRWPEVNIPHEESKAIKMFRNNHGGFRYSTSVAGPVTGQHSHVQVVDDPHKPLDLEGAKGASRVKIQQALDWWSGTMATRVADPKHMARVIIMQRLHTMDLTGAMLDAVNEGGEVYEHLRLPMRYIAGKPCKTAAGGDRRINEGDLLCPERFDQERVEVLERSLGSPRNVAAQLQQEPVPVGGNKIRTEWLRYWGEPDSQFKELPDPMRLLMSWDCTFKGKSDSDFVVGQVWGFAQQWAFLLDQVRGQWNFTETIKRFHTLAVKWPKAHMKLVEDSANGPALANVLKTKVAGIKLVRAGASKEERVEMVEELFEAGVVYIPPRSTIWVPGFVHELTSFPAAAHDDQVDACTQALKRMAAGSAKDRLIAFNEAMRRSTT